MVVGQSVVLPRRHPRVDVLGVQISAIDPDFALEEVARRIAERDPGYLTFTGVHGVMEALDDPDLQKIHNQAALVCPDGTPMVWAAKAVGITTCKRVYGPEFMLSACERSLAEGWSHFFYGGAEGVAVQLSSVLRRRFSGLKVAGTFTPPFRPLTEEERRHVIFRINESKADLVWVGLSTPKQERWMAEMRPRLDAPVLLGVGAAFDLNAGLKPQAPRLMQRSGLEWLFRLVTEPRRLAPRYLKHNPRFVLRILLSPPKRTEHLDEAPSIRR